MSIKPVVWMIGISLEFGFFKTEEKAIKARAKYIEENGFGPDDVDLDEKPVALYAIPDTHRVVPADALERIQKFATEARDYYSDMNDHVCQSYSDAWMEGVSVCKELEAIIEEKTTKPGDTP